MNKARRHPDIKLVTPDWLWCCAERWERIDERLFPLQKTTPLDKLRPPAHCSSPEIAFAERCNDLMAQRQNSVDSLPETSNPFLAMSTDELKGMNDEVDVSTDSEDDEEDTSSSAKKRELDTSSSEESLSGVEAPKGWTAAAQRKRAKYDEEAEDDDEDEDEDEEDDSSSEYNAMGKEMEGMIGSEDEEMDDSEKAS